MKMQQKYEINIIEATPETLRQLGINPKDVNVNKPIETSTIQRLCHTGKLSQKAQYGAQNLARLLNVWEICSLKGERSLVYFDCGNGARIYKEPLENLPQWALIEYREKFIPWKNNQQKIYLTNRRRNVSMSYFDLCIAIVNLNISIKPLRITLGMEYRRIIKALDKALTDY